MPEWLPKLSAPDVGVFALTIFLCLAASRVADVGDLIGRLFVGRAPPEKKPPDAP